MNDSAIIPVQSFVVETEMNSSESEAALGDQAKSTALAKELAVLRSHMEYRVNQLQELVEKEGAASQRAQLLDRITAQLRESISSDELLQTLVREIRSALKTDRVLVCQLTSSFSNQTNRGKVVTESVESQWLSLLNAEIVDPRLGRYAEQSRRGKVQAIANIKDAGLDQQIVRQLTTLQVQASLLVPIYTRNFNEEKTRGEKQLYGFLIAHQCNQPRFWQPSEIEFFRAISLQFSYALDELQLQQHQQAIIQQTRRLNQINDHLRQFTCVNEILMTAVEETRDALNCDRVLVYEFGPEWDGKIIAESVDSQWPAAIGAEIDDPCFAKRYVQPYQRGRVKATDNVYEAGLTECHLSQLEPFAVKANLVAPILVENQLKGLLVAHQCSGPRAWTELDIDLIRSVAMHLGYALDQASALAQQQANAEKAKILNNITYQLRNSETTESVFDLIVEQVRQLFKTDQVFIYKYCENGSGRVVAESVVNNLPNLLGLKIENAALTDEDLTILGRKRVYRIDNFLTCELNTELSNFQPYEKLLLLSKAKTHLIAPLITSTQLHGLLVINHATPKRIWKETELDFLKQLTDQVSLALNQFTLLQHQQTVARQEHRLNQINAILQESLDPADIFKTVVGETRTVLNVDRVSIYQFETEWAGKIVAESVDPKLPSALGNQLYDPSSTHEIQPYIKGQVMAIADIDKSSLQAFHLRQLKSLYVKAKLVAPIIAKQKLHGLLIIHSCSESRQWQSHEINFVRQLAVSVGHVLNQNFLQQQQQATQQATQLNQICFHIRQTLDPQQICQTAVEELLELMQADRIILYQPEVEELEVRSSPKTQIIAEAVRSGNLSIRGSGFTVKYPDKNVLKILSEGDEVALSDLTEAPLTNDHKQQLYQWQVQAALMIPVFVNQTFYVIETHCRQSHQWQNAEIELFKQVGLQVGYALEQAQLLQQVQESRSLAEKMMNEQQQQKQQLEHQIETFLGQIEDSFQGDLTVRAQVSEGVMGTVADFFNATIESLQQLVAQVHQSANVVTKTAAEREQEVENLSGEISQQTEAIVEALAQIQTLTHSIEAVSTSAQAAQTQVQTVAEILQAGDRAMNRTVNGILTVEKTIRGTAIKVKHLGESSQKISRIVKLINEFANQTHVLALNASVEASRISHQEGGFAMVATEVRTLAEQSGNATAEIEQMIGEIQAETHEVIQAMKVGLKRVLQETELVKKTRQTLTEIVQASNQTHEFVNQIATSAHHQAQTSSHLSETMQQVAAIAHASSQQSLEVRQAFSQLMQVAQELQQGVTQFKVTQDE
ncbi:GAF domain-containing protein [Lyngbya sp. PCC 8106]|uniref:GAF domain-containing protein n=1 Tax=Lyngbya sp. (strain PCC 8106) TaxID=313612 RepID=UPI0000EAAAB3|nr:GAF domain-containing protein [Lyngbya sp. PCC 8106]EAW35932.1 methyl-accepting chemotaxis protein [Lyngbya sp. PCC 8106]